MNYLDIVIAVVLFLFGFKGLRKGLVIEIVTLLAFGVGIYGAMRFSDFTADRLQEVMTIHFVGCCCQPDWTGSSKSHSFLEPWLFRSFGRLLVWCSQRRFIM